MARRLVEAGCSFVTMVMENPYQSGVPYLENGVYNWDSHAVNCHLFDDARVRLPIYDQAVTALVEDLHNRGLDQKRDAGGHRRVRPHAAESATRPARKPA